MVEEGDSLDGLIDNWLERRKEKRMARKPVYVDIVKIIECRDESFEEFSTGPAYEVKLQLDVRDFETCVALRNAVVDLVDRFNGERA